MWHNDRVAKFIVYVNIYVYTFQKLWKENDDMTVDVT